MPNESLITVEIDEDTLTAFGRRFRRAKVKQVDLALGNIKAQWQSEFIRQQRLFDRNGTWEKLSVDYLKRKIREYENHDISYLSLLKRTGIMLDGYVKGVAIDDIHSRVIANFPSDDRARVRAMAHQGITRRPKNMPARPFDLQKFEKIATKIMRDALTR